MARRQRDFGRERVASWQASGLIVREFCLQQGLTWTSFYFWKREPWTRDAAVSHGSGVSRGARRVAD